MLSLHSVRVAGLFLVLSLLLPGLAAAAGGPQPFARHGGGAAGLPGAAPPVPLPPPSVMAGERAMPAGEAPVGATAEKESPPALGGPPKADTLTLQDLRSRLLASRDAFWERQDQLLLAEYQGNYNHQRLQQEQIRLRGAGAQNQ